MKKKLNILCLFVFIALFLQVAETLYEFGLGVYTGINLVAENEEIIKANKEDPLEVIRLFQGDIRTVNLIPTKTLLQPDSILNTKTNEYTSVAYSQFIAQISPKKDLVYSITSSICTFLGLISVVVGLIYFIKLILSINKEQIFNWKNVKRLRIMGYALVLTFLFHLVPVIMDSTAIPQLIQFEGYEFNPMIFRSISDLFPALGCLIVAEIFAIGLKMKEEQELTI